MKKISLIFSLISVFMLYGYTTTAQTYALLDRRWYKPAIFTDSITRENLSEGLYPIYISDLDSLITLVDKFKNIKQDGFDRKFYYAEDFKTEHCIFKIENIKRAYGDGYEINLISTTPFGSNSLKISDPGTKLPQNQAIIRAFLSYLKLTKKNLENPKKNKRKNSNNPLTG